jgi:hypothetical protein
MTGLPIFAAVEEDLKHGWDAFTDHLHHPHYDQPTSPASPAPEAPAMSLIQTIESDAEHALAVVQELVRTKLPAAVADAKKIEPVLSNSLVDAFLSAAHVPVGAIEALLIPSINFLANAFPAPDAPPAGDLPMGQQPEPAPAA